MKCHDCGRPDDDHADDCPTVVGIVISDEVKRMYPAERYGGSVVPPRWQPGDPLPPDATNVIRAFGGPAEPRRYIPRCDFRVWSGSGGDQCVWERGHDPSIPHRLQDADYPATGPNAREYDYHGR